MYMVLVVPAILLALAGVAMSLGVNLGLSLIGLACFLGILARLTQAETYERDRKRSNQSSSSSSSS